MFWFTLVIMLLLLSSHLQPSPSTSSLSSNHSASPNVTSSAPSSARGETCTHFYNVTHWSLLADISLQSDSQSHKGSAGHTEHGDWTFLPFQFFSVLSYEVSEVRRQLGEHEQERKMGERERLERKVKRQKNRENTKWAAMKNEMGSDVETNAVERNMEAVKMQHGATES